MAKRLGRNAGREFEAIFNGPWHYVIGTEGGWRRLDELPKRHPDWQEGNWHYVSAPLMPTPDMPADTVFERPLFPTAIYLPNPGRDEHGKPYSNAQFALALPHQDLAVIVSSHEQMDIQGDTVMGALTDLGAQLLLVHDGHDYLQPVKAAGRFRLTLDGDQVKRYELDLAGIVLVRGKPILVQQRSRTEIRDVGRTAFEVPAAAWERLQMR